GDVALGFVSTRRAARRIRSLGTCALYSSPFVSVKIFLSARGSPCLKKLSLRQTLPTVRLVTCTSRPVRLVMRKPKLEVWTIGHSTHPLEEFIETLRSFDLKLLVDVRSFPGSRRYPHFNKELLKVSLPEAGIEYQ